MTPHEISIDPTAYIFVGLAILGGILSVHLRNIMHAIFSLMASILGIAILFLYLGSPFVASMQVVIYVGGISVAMVFAIMFSYSLGARNSKRLSLLTRPRPLLLTREASRWRQREKK